MNLIIYLINFILVVAISWFEQRSGNDKSIIISSLAVVALVVLNVITGVIKQLDKKPEFKHYYIVAPGVILIFMILLSLE